ncbi:SigB/SigF/SigG family RNA polymerase sigma factor [Actinomadura madurae]|nr:SigB/SigF/SigG family RNA polymerase sigma factor [Actinomadura madurae]MCP9980170.1 SigB/SigF/SigG family RNA polymerase sigma factor [Actinomadura madurae]MCQ0008301.1 SigB/SigF/SigG family RNA polymerase sigma factor [Actinomadura madurae]MCQ0016382.1 SigB/SigF/SigG family RNA polymerase sigma factor [Actinomadura madurae]
MDDSGRDVIQRRTTTGHGTTGRRVPSPRGSGNQPSDSDRHTQTLLERLHRLGPDDSRRDRMRADIVALNTGFATGIARRYAGRGEPVEDLVQVAYMGLVMAINRFDPTRGVPFHAYAYPVVAGEVRRHFRDRTWGVRVTRRIQELRPLLQGAIADFTTAHDRSPTTAELADQVGISQEETLDALLAGDAYRPLSLDAPAVGAADDDPGPLVEHLGTNDPDLEDFIDKHALRPLLAQLPERERTIVLLRFFGNQTQSQIATQLGISQMHVSRLLAQTLRQLRQGLLATP